jgi:hypothetical protein
MKHLAFFICLLGLVATSTPAHSQCMLVPVSLEDRVDGADAVVEARVVGMHTFMNPHNRIIHTACTLAVFRNFKGPVQPQMLLIYEGGRLDNDWHVAEPGLHLETGQVGIFTLSQDYDLLPGSALPTYTAFAGPQGVVAYNADRSRATDAFEAYPNIRADLFERITKKTGKAYQIIKSSAQSLIIAGENDHLVPAPPMRTQAVPSITSFAPTTRNAGVGDILTITGTNFGTYDAANSRVRFQNANELVGTYIDALALGILSWTDTEIQVVVRSGAGTGKIQVANVDGTATSAADLTVGYNLSNVEPASVPFRINLIGPNAGGYQFRYNTTFEANAAAKAAHERALSTWHCNTNFHLVVDATTTGTSCQADDGVNIISFDDIATCNRPCGVLGISHSYYSGCFDGTQTVWWLKGNDVIYKTDGTTGTGPCATTITWEFGPGAPSISESDFESVAVHELGHTHQIGHVVNPGVVMHRSLATGSTTRTISASSDIPAGLSVMTLAATNQVAGCAQPQHTPISPLGCAQPSLKFTAVSLATAEADADTDLMTCRPYKAYTVSLSTSAAPTGDAVLTFGTTGSTATVTADYALYDATNTAALTTLTFPNGSTANQSFTLRVYDDEAVESAETVLLNFTISGTTNALKAVSADTAMTVTITDNDALPTGGITTLYTENFEAGPHLSVLPTGWGSINFFGANINRFSANSAAADAIAGNYSLLVTTNHLVLDVPYAFDPAQATLKAARTPLIDGTAASNMKIAFDWKCVGNAGTDFGGVAYSLAATPNTPVSFFAGLHSQATATRDTINLPPALNGQSFHIWFTFASDGAGLSSAPLMVDNVEIFEGEAAPSITDTAIYSLEAYMGPNSTVAVYNNGSIMCVITNPTGHDYGCTTVEIDRQGTDAVPFQKTDPSAHALSKTMLITPTNNDPAGSYTIQMFFTEAEVAGWEAATGNDRADLTLFKSKSSLGLVSPGDPNPASNPSSENVYGTSPVTAVYDGGAGFMVQATFSTGFSGFGAGLPDPNGPIGVDPLSQDRNLWLTANQSPTGVTLSWQDREANSAEAYVLERSDALGGMAPLAKVAARATPTYLDATPLSGRTAWRVKRLNPDGVAAYSNVVTLVQTDSPFDWQLLPNPAHQQVQLLLKHEGAARLLVTDPLGRVVLQETLSVSGTMAKPLSLQGWPAGVYVFSLEVGGTQHTRRLVVLP